MGALFYLLRLDRLMLIMVLAGVFQYAPTAIEFLRSGNVQVWNLDMDAVSGAGPAKYVKDLFILFLGLAWPIAVLELRPGPSIRGLVGRYFLWLFALLGIGLLAYAQAGYPSYFLLAGLRWVLLAHSCFGMFVLAALQHPPPSAQNRVVGWILLFCLFDLAVALLQVAVVGGLGGLGLGQMRVTGVFNNAAVGGYFGLAMALFAYQLQGAAAGRRIAVLALALLIALSSGTRFAMIGVFVLACALLYERMALSRLPEWRQLSVLLLPMALAVCLQAYVWMEGAVGRGDLVGSQLEEGGRIANLARWWRELPLIDMGDFLFGRGLGVGTNTLFSMLAAAGEDPERYRFEDLFIDNAFVSNFFQFGLLGSLVLWSGVFGLAVFVGRRRTPGTALRLLLILFVFLLSTFTLNCFEQYFLVGGFTLSLAFLLNGTAGRPGPAALST